VNSVIDTKPEFRSIIGCISTKDELFRLVAICDRLNDFRVGFAAARTPARLRDVNIGFADGHGATKAMGTARCAVGNR
jgi:prepilin-type processing-associated H-X9-DG protein